MSPSTARFFCVLVVLLCLAGWTPGVGEAQPLWCFFPIIFAMLSSIECPKGLSAIECPKGLFKEWTKLLGACPARPARIPSPPPLCRGGWGIQFIKRRAGTARGPRAGHPRQPLRLITSQVFMPHPPLFPKFGKVLSDFSATIWQILNANKFYHTLFGIKNAFCT